jgi:hypothetical protein
MPRLTLLLRGRGRFEGQSLSAELARLLARADRDADASPGRKPQLQRHFDVLPRHCPEAPITHELDAGDSIAHAWLRADPAYVQADMTSGRMLACGDMGLSADDCDAFLQPLRPLFGNEGFPISAPVPQRWYLMLPRESKPPQCSPPDEVLGDDLHAHMPEGDTGRRWRRLLNEAQVILHNHPLNAQRIARGLPPVNSLWFWGGGVLPDHVRTEYRDVFGEDALLRGLGKLAGVIVQPVPIRLAASSIEQDTLIDLRVMRELAALERDWLLPAVAALRKAEVLLLDFADGARYTIHRGQRWRFWRRPLASLTN